MKILFINLPYYGHVIPTIGLVKELMQEGAEVTYMLPFDWQGKIAESGAKFDIRKLKHVPENVLIYPSVPQLEILKQADVFITHGGMNSVSEALVYGTPMVVIPLVSDQPVNARCIEKIGVGKRLEYSKVEKNVLKEMVFSVMLDDEIKENMRMVQQLIKDAPGNKGGAEMLMEYYKNCVEKKEN